MTHPFVARWSARLGSGARLVMDALVGYRESWLQRRGHGPSPRALGEIMDYYERSATFGPSPRAFSRLLRRNGVPDWPNPFPEGQEEHYRFHPMGFMAADLELIAMGWAPSTASPAAPASLSPSLWPTVEESAIQAYRARLREDAASRRAALVCWAMAIAATPSARAAAFPRLRCEVHPHNLLAATTDAVLHAPLGEYGIDPAQVWSIAQRKRLAPHLSALQVWSIMGAPSSPPSRP